MVTEKERQIFVKNLQGIKDEGFSRGDITLWHSALDWKYKLLPYGKMKSAFLTLLKRLRSSPKRKSPVKKSKKILTKWYMIEI